MNTIDYIRDVALPGAYALLPPRMRSAEADALLLAIGLQESRFAYRRQVRGPARGFWQFESGGGLAGVLRHHASAEHAKRVLGVLGYPMTRSTIHEALADNDVLAAAFARLLLYTDPYALPGLDCDPEQSWQYYLRPWRPGKPHRGTWDRFWQQATEVAICND